MLRLEAGEELAQLCQELELKVSPKRAEQLKSKYEAGGRQWEVLLDGRFGHAQQVNSAVRAQQFPLWERFPENRSSQRENYEQSIRQEEQFHKIRR